MPQYFQKPENALKRANEFIDIGKNEAALDVLYDVIKSKKHRNWQKIHEPILKLYLKLCVELKRSVNAKEGLYQYKVICQQVNIASLEEIISFFLGLAEKHAEDAKSQSIELVTVEDLDQLQTPEGLMLSSVSSEDAQDRSDRVLLTPWVKFLWEAYRNVLELLRNNNRVERLYHETAQSAFKFCLKFNRRAEFRKLCTLVKNHLDQVLKYQGQPTTINLSNPDSIQWHLETRLFLLESAITMELWQEAFRGIEGIHALMLMSKKPPKPHMMANYYEKVGLVFLKANNMLFHAAALLKLFMLTKEQKKTVTQDELKKIGVQVLLATLSINIPPGRSSMEVYLSYNHTAHEKERKLTTILGLINIPTRKSLVADVESLILPHVPTELNELFYVLEKKFKPLSLCKNVDAALSPISSDESFMHYVKPIQEIAIIRLLKQLSQIYESLSFDHLLNMIPFSNVHQMERIIVSCVKDGDMQMNINHQSKSITFGTALVVALKEEIEDGPYIQAMPSEILRSQLSSLAEGISTALSKIAPSEIVKEKAQERDQLIAQYQRQERKEHMSLLNRKSVIEARKEKIESIRNQQERHEQEKRDRQMAKMKIAEEKRLEEEREKREQERRRQEMKEIQKQQVWDRVDFLRNTDVGKRAFKNLSAKEIDEMDPDDILRRQYEQLEMEKKEQVNKLRTQEKRIDHLVRAMRVEEIPLLEKHLADKKVKDEEEWEKAEDERIKNAEREHKHALKTQGRLARMKGDKEAFLDNLFGNRHSEYEARLQDFEKNLERVRMERLEERRKQRMAHRRQEFIMERREEKRKEKEEQERRQKEFDEKRKQEEAEKKHQEMEERRKKLDEIERKKRQREAEIEEKLKQEQGGSSSRGIDELRHGGDNTPSPTVSSGGGEKYVPPSRRKAAIPESDRTNEDDGGSWRGGGGDGPRRDFGRRDDGQRRDGGFDRRDDGPRREGGFDRRDDGPRREGGFDRRDDGPRREGGFDRRDDGPRREGGFDRRNDGPRRDGGFDRRDGGGFDRRDGGGFDRRDGGGYDRRDGGYDKRDEGYDRRDGGGSYNNRRDGGSYDRRDGGNEWRSGGDQGDRRGYRRDGGGDTGGLYNRRSDNQYSDSPRRGWKDNSGGGTSDNWRSGGGGRPEGRSYQASRTRTDREREERQRDQGGGGHDDGWTTVSR